MLEVRVPDIGDFKDIPVIEVLVKQGDSVEAESPLITLESDKATLEVPSPRAGLVREIKVGIGDRVSRGTLVLTLEPASVPSEEAELPPAESRSEPASPEATQAGREVENTSHGVPQQPSASRSTDEIGGAALAYASPAVRRMARELGVDLPRIIGTGPRGRLLKEDVQNYIKQALATPHMGEAYASMTPLPPVDFSRFGPIELKSLTRIKRISGAHLARCWSSIPHVTHHDEADITELDGFRRSQADALSQDGVRLTLLVFVLKAAAVALKRFETFNASLSPDGEGLILKRYCHVGVAVDTPAGLVVPVIRDVDRKGLIEVATELRVVSARMRDGRINSADLQGGCFSVSSLGGVGGTHFTPIINAPEIAILGVGRALMRPVWKEGEFVPRLMLPLSLSYDHRVIDGAEGARFISFIGSLLTDIRKLML